MKFLPRLRCPTSPSAALAMRVVTCRRLPEEQANWAPGVDILDIGMAVGTTFTGIHDLERALADHIKRDFFCNVYLRSGQQPL